MAQREETRCDDVLITCDGCGRIWDGYTQCDCGGEDITATQEYAACPACHRPWDGYCTCICKMDIELIVCLKCFRFWDGCAQCNCDNCLICGKHYSEKCICCEENSFVAV